MSDNFKVLRVFIASPNDLENERRAIKEVADSLNGTFGKEASLHIQLLGWEDRLPGYGRPQAQINEDVDKSDLFVGFMWRRWGSNPGNPQYSSGFEEEFNRALQRRERTGAPEICLFFKEVDQASLGDPGDQLKRVLDFKEALKQPKKVLFRDFRDDISDWKQQARDVLECPLLRLLKATISQGQAQPQSPPIESSNEPAEAPGAKGTKKASDAAHDQVVHLWAEVGEAIQKRELAKFPKSQGLDRLKVARLALIAASMTNRDVEAELPGVHLINLLFKHRKDIELNPIENLLVLKTNLACLAENSPGWFWSGGTRIDAKYLLVYLSSHDDNAAVRRAAIRFAATLELPMLKRSRKGERPIELVCSHGEANTRKAGLEYLTIKGSARELPLIEKLRSDSDNDVRSQAELTRSAILLRANPTKFFESCVLTSHSASDDSLVVIEPHAPKISADSLQKALSHPDTKVRIFSAKELANRSLISLAEIKALKEEDVAEVLQAYYLKQIKAGQKFKPQEIREALRPTLFAFDFMPSGRVNTEFVVAESFRRFNYQELLPLADFQSEDGPIAYRVLAESHFDKFGPKLRSDLLDEFESLKRESKRPESEPRRLQRQFLFSSLINSDASTKTGFLAAALSGLAQHAQSSDREIFLRFVEHEAVSVRVAAIRGLQRVGVSADTELLLRIAEDSNSEVSLEAAQTALMLVSGETGAAGRLLKSSKPALLKLAIKSLLNSDPNKVWPLINDRLYDGDDEVRKIVCAYAVLKLSSKRLERLLESYLSKGQYFYNVVFFLDRVLYAKLPLRKLFRGEVERLLT